MSKAKAAPSPSYSEMEKKWRTESDLRTLQEAAEIRKDPKRLRAAQAMAKTKLAELQSISTSK